MPTYTFKLRDGDWGVEDDTGVTLRDRHEALRYAHDVVNELMRRREAKTRSWRLDVYENNQRRVFEILFVTVDPSLNHLRSDSRITVEHGCEGQRSVGDAVFRSRDPTQESRALLARSRGKPYLAAEFGRRTIRDMSDD